MEPCGWAGPAVPPCCHRIVRLDQLGQRLPRLDLFHFFQEDFPVVLLPPTGVLRIREPDLAHCLRSFDHVNASGGCSDLTFHKLRGINSDNDISRTRLQQFHRRRSACKRLGDGLHAHSSTVLMGSHLDVTTSEIAVLKDAVEAGQGMTTHDADT